MLDRVHKFKPYTRFRCSLCREQFTKDRHFYNHANDFHSMMEPNDSCTRAFFSPMTPKTSLKSLPLAKPITLADNNNYNMKKNVAGINNKTNEGDYQDYESRLGNQNSNGSKTYQNLTGETYTLDGEYLWDIVKEGTNKLSNRDHMEDGAHISELKIERKKEESPELRDRSLQSRQIVHPLY